MKKGIIPNIELGDTKNLGFRLPKKFKAATSVKIDEVVSDESSDSGNINVNSLLKTLTKNKNKSKKILKKKSPKRITTPVETSVKSDSDDEMNSYATKPTTKNSQNKTTSNSSPISLKRGANLKRRSENFSIHYKCIQTPANLTEKLYEIESSKLAKLRNLRNGSPKRYTVNNSPRKSRLMNSQTMYPAQIDSTQNGFQGSTKKLNNSQLQTPNKEFVKPVKLLSDTGSSWTPGKYFELKKEGDKIGNLKVTFYNFSEFNCFITIFTNYFIEYQV